MGIDAFPMGLLYIKSGEPMDSNISPKYDYWWAHGQ